MSLVRLKNVTKKYDAHLVLREVFFRVAAGERVGLIGKNGCGKTTLLRLILGREEPTAGTVEIDRDVKIGYFSQFSELEGTQSVQQVLEAVLAEVRAVESELKAIETKLDANPTAGLDALLERHAELLEQMEQLGGWTYQNKIDTVLSKLEFSDADRRRPVAELSGGWRNRAALAKILLEQPNVLLLDEPTNYLDIAGIEWLESWMAKFRGAIVLVTHDRDFLQRVAKRIVEVENHRLQEYEGGFNEYVRARPLRLKILENQFQDEEELLIQEDEAIRERREAGRDASGVIRRRLANIKKAAAPRPVDTVITSLYQNLRVPEQLGEVHGLSKAYDGRTLFRDLDLQVARDDRIAIVGPNGCGKSTLLRVLMRDEPADAGELEWRGGVTAASFNDMLAALEPEVRLERAITGDWGIVNKAPRKHVVRFWQMLQFSEADLKQEVGKLSGGQRARVALARCLLSGAGVLMLDEPTNHLDLTSAQVMERAILHYPGAVILASHDRFFIDKVATRLLVFEPGAKVRAVQGNWSTWERQRAG